VIFRLPAEKGVDLAIVLLKERGQQTAFPERVVEVEIS
jgi:hypothetical protein